MEWVGEGVVRVCPLARGVQKVPEAEVREEVTDRYRVGSR